MCTNQLRDQSLCPGVRIQHVRGTHSRDDARRRGINNACQPENYPSPTELAALDATIEELEQMNENLEAQFEYLYERI